MAEDHEALLKPLLFPLIAKVPQDHTISISSIVRKLKPTYPWLEEKSLRDYVTDIVYMYIVFVYSHIFILILCSFIPI